MIGSIPFGIPEKFSAGLADGSIVRFGALLKESKTGQIIAHLQETGLTHKIVDGIASTPFSPISAISSVGSNIQLHQLTKLVEGLKMLQYASLGASIAGIGVSAIGFILMNKKLNKIQKQMSRFEQRVEQQFQELKERDFRTHYSQIQGLYEEAEHASFLKKPESEWKRISSDLSKESAFFRGELVHILDRDIFDIQLFSTLIISFGICNAGRVECLLLARETQAALKTSETIAQHYTMFDSMNPVDLKKKYKQSKSDILTLLQGVRDAQDSAFTKPTLLNTLIEKEIDSHKYLMTLREEGKHPILTLDAA
mgnify:CR=1 FL=1|jgi:hypothetical protein